MNKKGYLLIGLIYSLFITNIMSQELKTPTLEDLIPGGETYRYAENLYSLQWWGDECIKPSIDTLFVIDPKTGKEKIIAIRETVNKVLEKEQTGKLPHFYSTSFPWADKEEMLIELPGKYVVYDFKNNRIVSTVTLAKGASNQDYCTATGNVAYTVGNNLYVNDNPVTVDPKALFAVNPYTETNSASTKAHSGIPKAICWHFTVWTKVW